MHRLGHSTPNMAMRYQHSRLEGTESSDGDCRPALDRSRRECGWHRSGGSVVLRWVGSADLTQQRWIGVGEWLACRAELFADPSERWTGHVAATSALTSGL